MKAITIYGIHAILEAINHDKPIEKVWLLKGVKNPQFDRLLNVLKDQHISISFVPEERLQRFEAKNHQGAVARIAPVKTHALEPLIEQVLTQNTSPLFVLLDGITDARNFGAILRSAAATGVHGVIIPQSGSAPINGDAIKTSAGALFKVPIARVAHLKDAIMLLHAYDIKTVGITEKAEKLVYQEDFTGALALVMGAEDKGISKGVYALIQQQTKLPMVADMDSLNVSVACAVSLYEVVRQRLG